MSEPTYLESSDGDVGGFAVLLDAPPDCFFAPVGSWARLTGETGQNRDKKSRTKSRVLGIIRMKYFPPDAKVRDYAALGYCEFRTIAPSTMSLLVKSAHF